MRIQTAFIRRNSNGMREWSNAERAAFWEKKLWFRTRRDYCPVCGKKMKSSWAGEAKSEKICFDCTIWLLSHFETWDDQREMENSADFLALSRPGSTVQTLPPSDGLLRYLVYGDTDAQNEHLGDSMCRL